MAIPKELFVSHANKDRRFVNRLARVLDNHGILFWYSRRNLLGAQEWHDQIGAALSTSDWFLVILSPVAADSEWVKRELVYALNEKRYAGRIIPLLLKPCDIDKLSWTLRGIERIDFSHSFTEGCRELMKIWGLDYKA